MAYVLVGTFGLIVWIVIWALGIKAFDAFMITLLLLILTTIGRQVLPLIPGLREDNS
jgi:hypothetical protein